MGWGGAWGGYSFDEGVYMASTDGRTEVWNTMIENRDHHGSCHVDGNGEIMKPSTMYWLTDLTPHAALPSLCDGNRQFIRVVSENISVWFNQHNTPNPLGIMPSCPIIDDNKFV